LALVLAGAATLGFVPEVFLPVKLLFTCGENEICPAVDALKYPILKFGHGAIPSMKMPGIKTGRSVATRFALQDYCLLRFPAALLPVPFTGEGGFNPLLLTWLQIEGMALDLFNDVFLLYLPLKATKGIFKSFALLQSYFCQRTTPPN